MKLYLVRHGEAVSEKIDPQRPLSEKGREEISKIAKFLKEIKVKIEVIWHSNKLRAKETAQIIANGIFPLEELVEREDLSPNAPVEKWPEEIKNFGKDLMIVGHLPFLQKLLSLLLLNSEEFSIVDFKSAGVISLNLDKEKELWQIDFYFHPLLMNL